MTASGRRAFVRWPLAAGAAALLPACGLLAPAEPTTVSAFIEQLPERLPHGARRAGTLLVLPTEARAAFDTQQMAYAQQPHRLAYYARHQWAERPAQMLDALLVRTLEATGAFDAVLTPPLATGARHELHTELEELLQDFTGGAPMLRLALRLQLEDLRARTVRTRAIRIAQPMRERSPEAGVLAANEAAQQALREVAGFVLEAAS